MKNFTIPCLIALSFASCQEVIDIDLNEAGPVLVVEGNYSDQPGPHQVSLTRSLNFDEPNSFPAVTGAVVTLSDQSGNTQTLSETQPGIYQISSPGTPGSTYTLNIKENEEEYSTTCYMPPPVSIDTVLTDSITFGPSSNVFMRVKFTDPQGAKNFYRIIEIINGDTLETINLTLDRYNDGQQITADIFSDMNPALNYGDTVTMILQTIDEPVFTYLRDLVEVINRGSQAASPANPKSNINGKALGYFSAHSERTMTVIVQ